MATDDVPTIDTASTAVEEEGKAVHDAATLSDSHPPFTLVFVHALPAAGKLTVGKVLAEKLGYSLFHNHLIVGMLVTIGAIPLTIMPTDAVLAVFPFGSPSFIKLRESMWLQVMTTAAREGRNLLFTFCQESTVDHGFPARLVAAIKAANPTARILFVELAATHDTIIERLNSDSRSKYHKLTDVELLKSLLQSGAIESLPAHAIPADAPKFVLDVDTRVPEDSAALIAEWVSAQ